jgi:hypothetical protein
MSVEAFRSGLSDLGHCAVHRPLSLQSAVTARRVCAPILAHGATPWQSCAGSPRGGTNYSLALLLRWLGRALGIPARAEIVEPIIETEAS